MATFDQCAILHEDHAAVDVHVPFQLLFKQFHVLGSIQSGVRWNEMQTNGAITHNGTPNHMARQVFYFGFNIFLVKMLT